MKRKQSKMFQSNEIPVIHSFSQPKYNEIKTNSNNSNKNKNNNTAAAISTTTM